MKMEQNRAPAAIVIARYGWKKNFAGKSFLERLAVNDMEGHAPSCPKY